MDRLAEIWDMQEFLNNTTLELNNYDSRIRDFQAAAKSGFTEKNGILHWWIQQYTLCALVEVQEYENEYFSNQDQVNPSNVKEELELIDVLHFIISMAQVAGMSYTSFAPDLVGTDDALEQIFNLGHNGVELAGHLELRDELFKVITKLPWKHWSKKKDFNLAEVREQIVKAFYTWVSTCVGIGMTPARVYDLYIQKNKVNIERQKSQSYSEDTKKPDEGHIK